MTSKAPTALIILDGFGDAPASPTNAISVANPRYLSSLMKEYPRGQLLTSGECVGLPSGLMGNSEVGHMNMGAGRVIWQDITRIDLAIENGSFARHERFIAAARQIQQEGGNLHLMGLISDGGVHSSDRHVTALLDLFRDLGVPSENCLVHAFTDGRDTPPRSAIGFVGDLEQSMEQKGYGRIATVTGRYFAMDRDQRWDRVERAYRALAEGIGETAPTATDAIKRAYERGENDEFIVPTVVGERGRNTIRDGDVVLFFNFRADRAREISLAFMDPSFDAFEVGSRPRRLTWVTMTRYRQDFPELGMNEIFAPQSFVNLLGDVVADAGRSQLRIAETEKYAHVTYFLNGGVEDPKKGEERILVPSPKVATYDLQPQMSAPEVTSRLVAEIERDAHDLIVLNLANPDMVGHTGILEAAVRAVRAVDEALSKIIPAILAKGGGVLLTADHGNCEKMFDEETGGPHTAHTTNPVPLVMVGKRFRGMPLREGGILADVSPTLLEMMGIDVPPEMTATSLFAR